MRVKLFSNIKSTLFLIILTSNLVFSQKSIDSYFLINKNLNDINNITEKMLLNSFCEGNLSKEESKSKELSIVNAIIDSFYTNMYTNMLKSEYGDSLVLSEIYNKQISKYKNKWEKYYIDKFYACELANIHFSILKTFETVLHSVSLKKLNKQQLYNNYKLTRNRDFDFKIISKRDSLKSLYKNFSEYYKTQRDKAWFGGSVPFEHFDSYAFLLKDSLQKELINFKWDNNDNSYAKRKQEFLMFNSIYLLSKSYKGEKDVVNYFKVNQQNWIYNHKFLLMVQILKEINDKKFLKNITKGLLEYSFNSTKDDILKEKQLEFDVLLKITQKDDFIMKLLLKEIAKNNNSTSTEATKYISNFPTRIAVTELIKLYIDKKITKDNKFAIKNALKKIYLEKKLADPIAYKMIEKFEKTNHL